MRGTARPLTCQVAGRELRRALNRHRHEFAEVASRLSGDVPRVGATPLMCRPEWVPNHPIRAPVGFGRSPVRAGRPGPVWPGALAGGMCRWSCVSAGVWLWLGAGDGLGGGEGVAAAEGQLVAVVPGGRAGVVVEVQGAAPGEGEGVGGVVVAEPDRAVVGGGAGPVHDPGAGGGARGGVGQVDAAEAPGGGAGGWVVGEGGEVPGVAAAGVGGAVKAAGQ